MTDTTVTTTPAAGTASKTSLMSIRNLLSNSMKVFKNRFTVLLAITLLSVIINALLSAFVVLSLGGSFTISTLTGLSVSSMLVIGSVVIGGIVMTIAYLWTSVALVVAITDTSDKIDIKATLQKAWTHVGSYFVLIVMMSFILVGASLFFVIPAIILSLWFSTAVYVLIVENVKGSGALVKSKRYVQGYTLQVFVRIIVLGLLFLVGTIITSQFVRIFNNSVVEFAINTTLSLFSTPFSMIYSYHVYKNLREIKGDVSAVPSSRLKTLMVICGLVGVLIVPLIAGGVIYAAMNLPKTPAPIDYSSTYDQMLEDSIQE